MSSPRYYWWGYVKAVIRHYPERAERLHAAQKMTPTYSAQPRGEGESRPLEGTVLHFLGTTEGREYAAVADTIDTTRALPAGAKRIEVIRLMYWGRTHNLLGAALAVHVSERTARRWHGEFVRSVGKRLGLMDF